MKKTTDPALEAYRRQLNTWVAAMAVHDNADIAGDAAEMYSATDIDLFTEGNLDKRADILDLQTTFLRPAFEDLDDLISEYIMTVPLEPFGAGPPDGAAFLRWLGDYVELTPEQADHVACRMARYGVEDAARADRKAHLRFQERLSVARRLAGHLERNDRLRIHLNPARAWAMLHTRELLDDQTILPADVLFYAVGVEIRSAVLDQPVPGLVEALAEEALTLDEWTERGEVGRDGLLVLSRRLAELGLVAIS